MEYYFNNLSPTSFQRLINGILVARYGDGVRLTPLRGADGGRDGETAPANPFYEYQMEPVPLEEASSSPKGQGRYLFQVKHHRTMDIRPSDARALVAADFEKELIENVINRTEDERVNYFFLITNVPSSKDAIASIDKKRKALLQGSRNLHADVWWQEQVVAFLDQMPFLWGSFPELFAGGKVPFLAEVINKDTKGLPRAVRIAIERQYQRDSLVKFKQIELEKSLTRLFVDLDVDIRYLSPEEVQPLVREELNRKAGMPYAVVDDAGFFYSYTYHRRQSPLVSALGVLLSETHSATNKILLEGGPGQGKSTITQMMAQIYRNEVLGKSDLNPEDRWQPPKRQRLPFRMELRSFAEWLGDNTEGSVEEYLASIFKKDSGGSQVGVDDIHNMVEHSPALLIFDGLDEVGSEELRDTVLVKIAECVDRFENNLRSDLRVIVTTRPPAIAGRREQLGDFRRYPIAPLENNRIENYLDRWLSVQLHDDDERQDVRESFERRQNETHVKALAKNPMQLSVLLHFIRLKGEAFPDRRAELYRDYFRTVIDRDVEKSAELRQQREIIELLHQLLGYKIHSLTEADKADGTLKREQLLEIVQEWMKGQDNSSKTANEIFKLGEERLGLIVALKGEGEEARYGYEIQPIREYFAAAYINEQIEGDAHNVYQALVNRPYWKEVALFLAGLRRPNEKADLITRAKELDKDDELGWRQDGRTIILQLLQEGVFSQPRHVFSEAMDFILDWIDPAVIRAPHEPKELLDVLPVLIKQGETKRHTERILGILHKNRQCNDEHVIYRLQRVASRLLDEDKAREELLQYRGEASDIVAKARILWPYSWGIDMSMASLNQSYWKAMSEDAAPTWWRTSIYFDIATNLNAPQSLHTRLFEEYVFDSTPIFELYSFDTLNVIKPLSNWAIWRLVSLQQLLLSAPFQKLTEEAKNSPVLGNFKVSYSGIDESLQVVVPDLIEALHNLLVATFKDEGSIADSLAQYISTVRRHLAHAGLAGWLACKIGTHLMDLYRYAEYASSRGTEFSNTNFFRMLSHEESFRDLWVGLQEFFGVETSAGSLLSADEELSRLTRYIYRYRTSKILPTHIRIVTDGEMIEVADLFARFVCDGEELPFAWLEEVPLNGKFIRPLVDKCGHCLPKLLKVLSERRFDSNNTGAPLLVQSMQRILKIARETDDRNILQGALVALSTSNFLNVAGIELTLKMIRATSNSNKSSIATNLFSQRRKEYERQDVKETRLIPSIAESIVRSPEEYSFAVISAATAYMSEHIPISLPSLLSLEDVLGLHVQQPKRR